MIKHKLLTLLAAGCVPTMPDTAARGDADHAVSPPTLRMRIVSAMGRIASRWGVAQAGAAVGAAA